MEWLNDLTRREHELRRRIAGMCRGAEDRRAAHTDRFPAPSQAEERFRRCVEPAVQEIDDLLEDYMCGRTEEEQARMRFEARLTLPVYSHLRSLFAPSPTRR